MPAECPECNTLIPEPESEQTLPSVVTLLGEKGVTALVAIYKCGCGHTFTTIDYEPKAPPPLTQSKTEPMAPTSQP